MKLDIKEKKENPLLHRTEILAEVTFEGATPSNAKVKKALASELKADESVISMRQIKGSYGSTSARVVAHIYESAELMDKVQPSPEVKTEEDDE